MPITEAELAAIERVLNERPDGISMGDLVGAGASETERSAMRSRLTKLIKAGRARSEGSRRWTRYYAVTPGAPPKPSPPVLLNKDEAHLEAEGGLFVPVSEAGRILQEVLARPQGERKRVGYNRDFLAAYQPNKTFFLSPRERKYLAEVGVTGMSIEPAGTYAKHILNRILIDLSFNSSRLEGNDYSLLDTIVLLEQGKGVEGKSVRDTQMILNHKDAIEFLVESANEVGFDPRTIRNLHGLLSNNLLADPMASGQLRRKEIGIGGSVYEPLNDPHVLEECFNEMLQKAAEITDPFEQSIFISIQLPYLQPFEDVNKRVSRLAANIPFIRGNLSPISFIDVPETTYAQAMLAVYELNATELARDMYVWAYERSARRYAAIRQTIGEPDKFRLQYREQLKGIIAQVIRDRLNKTEASKAIADFALDSFTGDDIARFVDAAEGELVSLHDGNFARYRVRPSEFTAWKAVWDA
ncbi:MAG: Fic family protein [Hyphomonadaceae bacterium]